MNQFITLLIGGLFLASPRSPRWCSVGSTRPEVRCSAG